MGQGCAVQHLLLGSWAGPVLPLLWHGLVRYCKMDLPRPALQGIKGCCCFVTGLVKERVPASAWHTVSKACIGRTLLVCRTAVTGTAPAVQTVSAHPVHADGCLVHAPHVWARQWQGQLARSELHV